MNEGEEHVALVSVDSRLSLADNNRGIIIPGLLTGSIIVERASNLTLRL